ncbi:LysE family translocator [Thiomonas sp.]|jgi:threonine/homoserine/homoserine lactone efflux protein|uniref:LysE family translocator n=1 Tax=Thiomonas sp. TaxID=2047785 RepID=UPI00260BE8CD|nr:LysE family translocator [Thiomonas sp.]
MISAPALGLFAGFAGVASFTPGPAVMLAVNNAMQFGWRRSLWSSMGNISGLLTLSALSALGINAVLQSSATAFTVLKTVGALYLIWLGIQQWRRAAAMRRAALAHGAEPARDSAPPARNAGTAAQAPARVLYRRGLGVALTNPKAIAFIAALFPQFLRSGHAALPQYALLTGTFMAMSLLALSSYAALAVLARRPLRRWFDAGWPQRASAGVFCAFGLAMLRLHRN